MKSLHSKHVGSHAVRSTLIVFGALALGVVGCNSILDNKAGTLKQSTDVEPNTPAAQTSSSSSGGETLTPTQPTPTPPSPTGECAADTVLCNGQCVGKNDPAYGCGSCTACAITHASSTCTDGACAVKQCDRGYGDCNVLPGDGCETDLSKKETCGACGTACGLTAPVCSPVGDSFACGLTCGGPTPYLCSGSCVDTQTNPNNCNTCGVVCPAVENGDATCTAGQCGFTCKAGTNSCGGKCVAANDVTACGATCTVCPVPPHMTPTCTATGCSAICATGFADCNALPADGCEADTTTDLANCGGCNMPCNGTCAAGVCTPAPTDDAGTPPPPP